MRVLILWAHVLDALLLLLAGAALWLLFKADAYYRRITGERLLFNPYREGSITTALLLARRMERQREARRAGLKGIDRAAAHGVVFGLDEAGGVVCSPEDEDGHILAIGGTRSGKTAALLIPTLRAWQGSAFVLDISGDIAVNAKRQNAAELAPLDGVGCYDVFAAIDAAQADERPAMLQRLAYSLLPDSPGGSEAGAYFTSNGRKILSGALMLYYAQGLDFCECCERIVMQSAPELLAAVWMDGSNTAKAEVSDFRGANDKNIAGCKAAAGEAVALYASSPAVRRVLHRPGPLEEAITPATIEQRDIIIRLKEESLELYAPLLSIITEQLMQYLTTRPALSGRPVLLALDEFARLGKLGNILAALATLAKRRVRCMILTQSLADLDLLYGQEARRVICDNCQYKAVLRATDPDTQEYFAKLVGQYDRTRYSHTWGSSTGDSMTKSTAREYIIQPEEFGTLGDDLVLICPGGYERLRKAYYFKA